MRNKSLALGGVLTGVIAITATWSSYTTAADASSSAAAGRIFEMRTYYTNEGKINDLHARFRDHTSYLFVKHGITLVGYWSPVDDPTTLVYMLAYPSREAREKSWKGFMGDPAWQKAFKDSTADGRLVKKIDQKFLTATDYSPIR